MVERPLQRYKDMRDFEATPEPEGAVAADGPGNRFVIQQHDATRLHWDLRLEHDGVLLSWALPRGLPWNPKVNHLAVHTEDHPIEYLTFAGDIPDGSYGAGAMTIWDTGTYEASELTDRKAVVILHGERANGRYALFQTRGRDWMIHRMDPPEDPTRRALPDHMRLMHAVPGDLPEDDEGWAFEVLWQGCRALVASSGGVVSVSDAEGADVSASFPEVRRVGRALGYTEVVLDGVIVSPSDDASWVERRLAAGSESTIRRHARDHPLVLMAFDLLWLDGHPITDVTWEERREALESLGIDRGPAWQVPTAHRGDGRALADAARANGVPGLVAKRTDSPYSPKQASGAWVRIDLGA